MDSFWFFPFPFLLSILLLIKRNVLIVLVYTEDGGDSVDLLFFNIVEGRRGRKGQARSGKEGMGREGGDGVRGLHTPSSFQHTNHHHHHHNHRRRYQPNP